MADDDKKQVNVDFTKYPDLYAALEALVDDLDTDRSKLIRQLVRERVEEHKHIRSAESRIKPKIKQVAKS